MQQHVFEVFEPREMQPQLCVAPARGAATLIASPDCLRVVNKEAPDELRVAAVILRVRDFGRTLATVHLLIATVQRRAGTVHRVLLASGGMQA